MSVYALAKVGAPAIAALAAALKHPDAIVQESAAEALGMMNDAGAIEPLSEALQGQADGVREMSFGGWQQQQ